MAEWCTSVLDRDVRLEVKKIRCWSSVWRVITDDGTYYAKLNCPGQQFEAPLMGVLARLSDRVVPVTAVDEQRGFLLTPDQGPVLGDTVGDDIEAWCAVAREGALLQRDVAGHVDELAEAGVTRLGAAEAATYVVTRVEQYAALPADDLRHLTAEQAATLRTLLPDLEGWVERTLALGLPVTLNHSDLHYNNVFATEGGMRFFDFGDSVLSDPLSVLLVTLRSLAWRLECNPDDPRLTWVAEAGLEVWSDLTPIRELRAGLDASLQIGKLARSESWARCLANATDEESAEFGDSGAFWLMALTGPPLGGL
jgi:hypothetical protein